MNFLAPELLLGLLLVPIAIGFYLWAQRRRSKYAVRFTNLDLLANIAPRRPSWRRHLPPVLYLAAIAALLIGLARPTMVMAVPREDATVILTLDVSGSMKATDVDPTRLDAARAAAQSFIDQLPAKVRVGIVAFASQPQTLVSPTTDRAQLKAALDSLRPRDGTAMGDALMQVLDIAQQIQADATAPDASAAPSASPSPSVSPSPSASPGTAVGPADVPSGQPLVAAILLSDGANSVGQAEPLDAAKRAASMNVPIYTIALGTPDGSIQVRDNFGQLQTVPRPAGHRDPQGDRGYDRRQGVRRTDRAGPRQRVRQPPVEDRLHAGDAGSHLRPRRRRAPAGHRRRGPLGGLVRPAPVGAGLVAPQGRARRVRPCCRPGSYGRPAGLAGRVPSRSDRRRSWRPDARLRCRRAPHRVPGPGARAGRAAGRLPRWPGRHPGAAAGDRRRGRLLPRHERQLGRRVHDERGVGRHDGRGPRRGRRLPRGRVAGRDQVRLQHVDAYPPHRAVDRGDAPAG